MLKLQAVDDFVDCAVAGSRLCSHVFVCLHCLPQTPDSVKAPAPQYCPTGVAAGPDSTGLSRPCTL